MIVHEPTGTGTHELAARIARVLHEPIRIDDDVEVQCPASIGCVDTTSVERSSRALLAAADDAMYKAKRERRIARSMRAD